MTALQPLPQVDFIPGVRLLARLTRVAEQACQTTGISLPQYRLLASVIDGPHRASALASRVGVSRPTLTSLVDGLEHAGLLRRVPVPTDRRGIELEATSAGLEAVGRADVALTERFLGLLDAGQAAQLVDVVRQIGHALDDERRH